MNHDLNWALTTLNRTNRVFHLLRNGLMVVRALLIATLVATLWSLVRPTHQLEQLTLGALAFLISWILAWEKKPRTIGGNELILSLEMQHPDVNISAVNLRDARPSANAAWQPILVEEITQTRRIEKRRLLSVASTLVLPLLLTGIVLPQASPSFEMALSQVSSVVDRLGRGASLKVIEGSTEALPEKPYDLESGSILQLELLSKNLIEVIVTGRYDTIPTVELRRLPETGLDDDRDTKAPDHDGPQGPSNQRERPVFQSFQMIPAAPKSDGVNATNQFSISFAVTEPMNLYIPILDDSAPLATISVKQLPVPKVHLSVASELEDPWPDDQPLALNIRVKAKNPLELVRLLIKSGDRVSKELVANVMAENRLEIDTEYELILEPYVESDLAQVEIVAEAIDRAVPSPLAGYSEPLRLNTASAYGRYRRTLSTLRELKSQIDSAVSKPHTPLPTESTELARKASSESERSPFFDALDRVQIQRFEAEVTTMQASPPQETLLTLSQNLNDFLFEHEMLDDRERDRDFFVAARGLSRLLEQAKKARPVAVSVVTERIKSFLDDRQGRWQKRVEWLGQEPESWPRIRDKAPFKAAMDKINDLDASPSLKTQSQQLQVLSEAVVNFRSWIEELEALEDKMREQRKEQRQQGLASARDAMRELQKRQGDISKTLDRAMERSTSELEGEWPSTRMRQNTNLRDAKRVESQLRSLSPMASMRVEAAMDAMEANVSAGNEKNFVLAESASDLAGRLLRQAQSAAQRSQQQQRSRGRRRRVAGDNYYGQSVVGGDVEIRREYQVDRRYREDILDEVQQSGYGEEDQSLLESYLRKVIR